MGKTKEEYAAYLQSDHWRNLRSGILKSKPKCERCRIPRWLAEIVYDQDLHVHHKSYLHLGAEREEELEVLCRRCHEIESFGRTELKSPKTADCGLCGAVHWNYRSDFCSACTAILEEGLLESIAGKEDPRESGDLMRHHFALCAWFNPSEDFVDNGLKIIEFISHWIAVSRDRYRTEFPNGKN